MAALEGFYDKALFERRANGLVSTLAGQALARHALRCVFFIGKAISGISRDDHEFVSKTLATITTTQLAAVAGMQQHDSFRSAAEFAGVRAATMQKTISALEAVLGRALTDRHPSGAQLNITGKIFSSWARRAIAELSAAAADIHEIDGHITGTVAIGAIRVSASEIVPQAIAAISRLAPSARFHVMQANYQVMMEALRGGSIDYLCSTVRDNIPPDIDGEIIGMAKLRLFCSVRHPLAGRSDIPLADLAQCKWIGPAPLTGAAQAFRRMFEHNGLAAPGFTVETTSTDVTEHLVRTGSFLAVGNAMHPSASLPSDLTTLDVDDLDLVRPMWLLYRRGWQPTRLQAQMHEIFTKLYSRPSF